MDFNSLDKEYRAIGCWLLISLFLAPLGAFQLGQIVVWCVKSLRIVVLP
jgi:hypothetical protein